MSLDSTVAILQTRRDTVATELAAIGAMGLVFSLDEVSIDNTAYAQALRDEIMKLTAAIEDLTGPCIVYTQGR